MSDGPEPAEREGAIPATYRRAPRTERFIVTGVGIGALVGALLGALLPADTSTGRGAVALILALAGALAGGLVTGAQAAMMEYISGRSADRQRDAIMGSWDGSPFPAPATDQAEGDADGSR